MHSLFIDHVWSVPHHKHYQLKSTQQSPSQTRNSVLQKSTKFKTHLKFVHLPMFLLHIINVLFRLCSTLTHRKWVRTWLSLWVQRARSWSKWCRTSCAIFSALRTLWLLRIHRHAYIVLSILSSGPAGFGMVFRRSVIPFHPWGDKESPREVCVIYSVNYFVNN